MKRKLIFNTVLLMTLLQCFIPVCVFAQTASITVTSIQQRTDGSGNVDVYFDLSGPGSAYNIAMQASFDGGTTYIPIPPTFQNGDIAGVSPGSNKHIEWDGLGSFPNIYTSQAKLELTATEATGSGTPCPGMPSFIDPRDGHTYYTVFIGSQCWMRENLNVGTLINSTQNQNATNGIIEKYCYNNNETNCSTYGGLYQWDEIMQGSITPGIQGICPNGWHIPSQGEYSNLILYLGSDPGGKIKTTGTIEAGTGLWHTPNVGATNSSGFSANPGGARVPDGTMAAPGYGSYFWSSTQTSSSKAWSCDANYNGAHISQGAGYKSTGWGLRCVKD